MNTKLISSLVKGLTFTPAFFGSQCCGKTFKVVMLRHGESTWNKQNRFTGWTDVALSQKGIEEARSAGKVLKQNGF